MTAEQIWNRAVQVWETDARELARLPGSVDRESFTRCVEVIAGCPGRIITLGCGTSGVAARKIAHSLSCVERPTLFLSPSDAPHGALGVAQPGDVAILVSKGGATTELLNLLPALRAKKLFLIAVTENERSELAGSADLLLQVKVEREADGWDMLATTSTLAVIAVFDAVCIALMELTGYSREAFAVIHPPGAGGPRLRGGSP
jgi:D-arabinose 5-phosphate isomerase GutQ